MKKLSILFINPCLRPGHHNKILPVGLAHVMTYVKSQSYEFDLLDVDIHNYSDEFVEDYIRTNPYDVILYGSIVTHYAWIKWLTHTIKRHQPDTQVVVGNSVAGSCWEVFMDHAPADVVIIGEGEFTCVEVLDAFRSGTELTEVEGIAFRNDQGQVVITPKRKAGNIHELPVVDWKFFEVDRYLEMTSNNAFGLQELDENTVVFPVSTARGCAFRCTFCHFVFWDDLYRYRTPESVLDEIRRNVDEYGANYINFWDDLSFAGLKQVEKMCQAILDSDLQFEWSAAIRTDLFGNPKTSYEKRRSVAEMMKQAGCRTVGFSLESGNQEILKMMNKRVRPEWFSEQIRILNEVGIISMTSAVFGYPIETKETIRETFAMCLSNRVYPSIGFLLPLPYTGMYDHAKEHGFITDEDAYLTQITERQDFILNMTQLSEEEVMDEIKAGATELNRQLELGLDDDSLIRTGGYRNHTHRKRGLDPEQIERNPKDFSFNYSEAVFDENRGDA